MKVLKRLRDILLALVVLGIVALGVYFGFNHFYPETVQQKTQQVTKKKQPAKKSQINLVALGDSLTQGVGDQNKAGGYVGMIKHSLVDKDHVQVKTANYGVAGDTSTQIDHRLQSQAAIQTSLKKADVIVMTVGGNDLMGVVKKDMLDTNEKDIQVAQKSYTAHLTTLLGHVRQYNAKAPIFLYSIYNPFYVYFPKMTKMQDAVVSWNTTSQQVLQQSQPSHFVNICNLMSKSSVLTKQAKDSSGGSSSNSSSSDKKNPLISTEDNFHPNVTGYRKMTQKLYTSMQQNQKEWLEK
ncbi:SGNH/GDSL hydrolase family protein [Loigolactobacillus iwatensis]|uniref:SGNH/GDSL hydrolase family protein n=1 Tax=Loigolactobacillus iwatensis TaxID=1267156 RepID=UPI001CDCD5AB|nr:SGNH/GDSL hydrolase family protein [Loigolactobacillus iwatensis]